MIRGDYTRIARVLLGRVRLHEPATGASPVHAEVREVCLALADEFAGSSIRFDRGRFLNACGVADRPAVPVATVAPTAPTPAAGDWLPRVGETVRVLRSLNGGMLPAGCEAVVESFAPPNGVGTYEVGLRAADGGATQRDTWCWSLASLREHIEPMSTTATPSPVLFDPATLAPGTALVTRAPFPSQNAAGIVQQVQAGRTLTVETCTADGPRYALTFRELPQAHGNLYRWPAATVGRLLARVAVAPVAATPAARRVLRVGDYVRIGRRSGVGDAGALAHRVVRVREETRQGADTTHVVVVRTSEPDGSRDRVSDVEWFFPCNVDLDDADQTF